MHEVAAGKMSGVELLQWLALPEKGKKITNRMDVWKHFELVLGRAPLANEFNEQVFVGKTFLASVGFAQKNPKVGAAIQSTPTTKKVLATFSGSIPFWRYCHDRFRELRCSPEGEHDHCPSQARAYVMGHDS